jgi:LysM repeat protein
VVKSHDTLARIAHQHHVKVAALRSANGLKNDFLHVGQKLTIPARAHEESTGLASLREPNTTLLGDSIPDSTKPASHDKAGAVSTGGRHLYIVSKGDTLTRIARKFHTSSSAIMVLNNISDARKLRLGQKLKIPSQEARSATSAPAARSQPDRIEPRATPTAQLANFIP